MNRRTFLETLRRALYGKIDDTSLEEHVRYYEGYISQEMRNGRPEQEILNELGDPRLIARTILEAYERKGDHREYTVDESGSPMDSPKISIHRVEGWKAALGLFLFFAIVLLLLIFVFRIIIAILPFLVVAGLIFWLFRRYGS